MNSNVIVRLDVFQLGKGGRERKRERVKKKERERESEKNLKMTRRFCLYRSESIGRSFFLRSIKMSSLTFGSTIAPLIN